MRSSWAAVLLVLPLLGGCLDLFDGKEDGPREGEVVPADVGFDPQSIRVTGFEKTAYTVPSFDETALSTVIYAPVSSDTLPDGSPPRWGVVVFLHGWGFFKEQYQGVSGTASTPEQADPATSASPYGIDRLQAFAEQGLIAVAYDARGFGQSGGQATVAGPAELADLDAVLDFVAERYSTNGLVGIVGQSYGGGQAFQAWADDPRITTIVPMFGWVDLYEGLAQGNVPKAEWVAKLLGGGYAGSKGQLSPMVGEWSANVVSRGDLATVEAQMDLRSALPSRLATVEKPLFLCQGLQETLFPQADLAWEAAGGFTRVLMFQGGHGAQDETCFAKSLDWMLYFVGGRDTGVDAWPALTTVDAAGGAPLEYADFPQPVARTFYLREPTLANDPSDVTFTIDQRLLANPFAEPSGVWESAGLPFNQVPEQLRQDPTAVFFDSPAFTGSDVLMGAPTVRLHLADPATSLPFQVTGVLYHVDCGGDPACPSGKSRILSHAAAAVLDGDDAPDGVVELRFWWTKTNLEPGDKLVLKLGANEPSVWMPLLANYSVEFTGASELTLPFFEG